MQATTIRCHLFTRLTEGRVILDRIEDQLKSLDYDVRTIKAIFLAMEEALANAVKHGNRLDESKLVRLTYQVSPVRFEAHVEDEGEGFDPAEVPDPTEPENLERNCGRGVFLIRHAMCEVTYSPRGNAVHMIKYRQPGAVLALGDTISDATV